MNVEGSRASFLLCQWTEEERLLEFSSIGDIKAYVYKKELEDTTDNGYRDSLSSQGSFLDQSKPSSIKKKLKLELETKQDLFLNIHSKFVKKCIYLY